MIREARPGDLPRLRAVQTAAIAESWPDLLELGVDGPPLVLVADPVAGAGGADQGGDPVGYALAVTADDAAYLVELAVAPEKQRQGYGSDLLAALVARLRAAGVGELRLTVLAGDDDARRFYDRHGFAAAERLPDHYDRGDGVLMVRSLDGDENGD